MKRIAILLLAILIAAPCTWAQPEPGPAAGHKAEGHEAAGEHEKAEPSPLWAWANFVILMVALVYLFRKNAAPFFASRALDIRKGMIEADDIRADAERRMAAVDARMARLQADIDALRQEALAEQNSAAERIRQETTAAVAKIRARAEQEIAASAKAARTELKRHSARLALSLAEQKIRARLTPDAQDSLVRGFVHQLATPPQGSRP